MPNDDPVQNDSGEVGPSPADDDPVAEWIADCLEQPLEEQAQAVDRICRQHSEHAGEIRARIQALRDMGLVRPALGDGDPTEFPERLGEFRLLRRLGGGGMGVVYLAEQESLGREVALKVIRPEHLFFPQARKRFRRESEAVAKLHHPGIVPIFTVGETSGVPYFAMELVAGCTLGEVLDEVRARAPESLTGHSLFEAIVESSSIAPVEVPEQPGEVFTGSWAEACVRLVVQVAEALQHAHDRGVLHRDVKPSNIAVTAEGRAMLLDFGLASSEEDVRMTASGTALGSILYMSPEQVRGDHSQVGPRSDVYSLGTTLYEILALQAAYSDSSPMATRQAIVEGRPDPIRARNRAVSRDLETVCLKAMEVDSGRRYASPAAFAEDLRNVLELRPVLARPPSAALRAKRWVQRNPAASVALGLGFLLVVGTPTGFMVQGRRHAGELKAERDIARTEARDAQTVAEFLEGLFAAADPERALDRELTVRELLDDGAERLLTELDDQPVVKARLTGRIGRSYASLGAFDKALPLLEDALERADELHGPDSLEVAEAAFQLGRLCRISGVGDPFEPLERALETRTSIVGADDILTLAAQVELAVAFTSRGQYERTHELYEQILAQIPAEPERELAELRSNVLFNVGSTLLEQQEYDAALEYLQQALDADREWIEGDHPRLIWTLNAMGVALKNTGALAEAEAAYDEATEMCRSIYGEDTTYFAGFEMNRAALLQRRGQTDEAEALYRRALERFDRLVGPDYSRAVTCAGNLAGLLRRSERYEEARTLYLRALGPLREKLGPLHGRVKGTEGNLGMCHYQIGELAEARELFEVVLDELETDPEESRSSRTLMLRAYQAHVERLEGRAGRAREAYRANLEIMRETPAGSAHVVGQLYGLARVQLDAGELDEAGELLDEAWTGLATRGSFSRGVLRVAQAELLVRSGEPEQAELYAREGYDLCQDELAGEHPEWRALRPSLARTWLALGRPDEARRFE